MLNGRAKRGNEGAPLLDEGAYVFEEAIAAKKGGLAEEAGF